MTQTKTVCECDTRNLESFQMEVRAFVQKHILPNIRAIEQEQRIDDEIFKKLAEHGYLGANIPQQYGGSNLNSEELGILHEEFGKGHASVENILTVVGMAVSAIKLGSRQLKEAWLPKIAKGEVIPGFALTEPGGGSDIQNLETHFESCNEGYIITGKKKWITLGSRADIFIVFARNQNNGGAILIERNVPGIEINPIQNMLGFRGNMLAEVTLSQCKVIGSNLIGSLDAGMNIIAPFALNEGRFMTAWGAVGLAQAALDKSVEYIKHRKLFGKLLKDHDSIKQTVGKMRVSIEASRQLCRYAGFLRDQGDPESIKAALMAKYQASKTASQVSERAVQLLGAYGCHQDSHVERYFRDAKIMELIEGASEVLEIQMGSF